MGYAYYNGTFCKSEELRIPLSDRSIFFADGVYDAAIGRNGSIFLCDEHIDRLLINAKRIQIQSDISRNNLTKLIEDTIKKSGLSEYFIYIQISHKSSERLHAHTTCNGYNLLISVNDFRLPPMNKKLKLMPHSDIRHMICDIKTTNLLPAVLASSAAEDRGYDEAVFHRGNTVTECTHSNISIIKNGILYTHPTNNLILPGITRKRLLCVCERLGIPFKETPFDLSNLMNADEVLVTSTSKLCLSASLIGSTPLPDIKNSVGERLNLALRDEFFKNTNKNC